MIALMMMGAVALYIAFLFIALWLLPKVIKIRHIKRIIFIVWFLIPTWDVIIGYPIYKFLCATQAGVKIYKTVDNVEGFYVGEQSKKFEPREPYEGYRYVDYKEKESSKYYRSYWIDNNISELCVPIGDDKWTHNSELYSKHFKSGKCIVKEEIDEREVSELWSQKRKVERYLFFYLNIYSVEITIEDRKNHEKYFIVQDYFVDNSWITGALNFVSGTKHSIDCFEGKVLNTTSGFTLSDKFVLETLQQKGEK